MKKVLVIFFIALSIHKIRAQCGPYINYASCSDTVGTIYYNPSDCGPNTMVIWSTGDTSTFIVVPPGVYSAALYVNNVYWWTDVITMFHDTWQLSISPVGPGTLHFDAYLPYCNTSIFTHPSCTPPYPSYATSLIVWEDGNPVDTLNNVFCFSWSADWSNAQSGHYYDISIYDTVCNCHQATWMYTPVQTYYYSLITGDKTLSSQARYDRLNHSIYNSLGQMVYSGSGALIRENHLPIALSPGIYFVIYYDALDNRQVLTDKVLVGSQP